MGAYNKEVIELVIARLSVKSPNVSTSFVGLGSFTRDEMIEAVEQRTKVGEAVVRMELDFIKEMSKIASKLSR